MVETERKLPVNPALSQTRFWIIGASSLSIFLAVFSSSMLNVALPTITETLEVSLTAASWLVSLFLVIYGLGMPLAGFASVRWGERRIFLMGAALFGIGSILAFLIPNFESLLAARSLQGLGAAAMFPATVALLRSAYAPHERGKAMGILGASASAGTVLGPPVSAYLLEVASYKAIFLLLLPILVAIFTTGLLTFPARLDTERSSDSPERRNLSFISNPRYLGTLGMVFTQNLAIYGIGILIPVFLQQALGYTLLTVGKVMVIMPLAVVFSSPLGGWWSDRAGHQWPVILGSLLFMSSVGIYALNSVHGFLMGLILNSALGGAGLGLATGQLTLGSISYSEAKDTAKAAGLFGLSRQLGGVVGATLTPLFLSFAMPLVALRSAFFPSGHGNYALTFVFLALIQGIGLVGYVSGYIGAYRPAAEIYLAIDKDASSGRNLN